MSQCGGDANKNLPEEGGISSVDREPLDSCRGDSGNDGDETEADSILSLRGLGKDIWEDEEADDYVRRLRGEWRWVIANR